MVCPIKIGQQLKVTMGLSFTIIRLVGIDLALLFRTEINTRRLPLKRALHDPFALKLTPTINFFRPILWNPLGLIYYLWSRNNAEVGKINGKDWSVEISMINCKRVVFLNICFVGLITNLGWYFSSLSRNHPSSFFLRCILSDERCFTNYNQKVFLLRNFLNLANYFFGCKNCLKRVPHFEVNAGDLLISFGWFL